MSKVMQALVDAGINAWAVELMCESLLKHPSPITIEFDFPVRRKDCPDWVGVRIRLEPIPATAILNPARLL